MKGKYLLTDTVISGNINVIKEEAEKVLNFKHLIIEIHRTCNVQNSVSSNKAKSPPSRGDLAPIAGISVFLMFVIKA